MEQRNFVTVAKPPLEMFLKRSSEFQEHFERPVQGNSVDRIEYPDEGGIFVHYYDHPFPAKGQVFPEAVESLAAAKKSLKATAYFLKDFPILASLFLSLPSFVTRRFTKSFLENYLSRLAHDPIEAYFLAEDRWCRSVREIRRAGKIAIEKVNSKWKKYHLIMLNIVSSAFEWDNAYRYRGQDVGGELNKKAFFENPIKEVVRLMKLQVQRERGWFEDKGKFIVFGQALRILMIFVPEIKKLMIEFVKEVNIDEVKLDEADDYYNLMRPDYDVHGWPMELRQQKWLAATAKYDAEYPNRRQDGAERIEQERVMSALQQHVRAAYGLPVMFFYAEHVGTEGKVAVRLLETKLLRKNPSLLTTCKEILISRESGEDAPQELP